MNNEIQNAYLIMTIYAISTHELAHIDSSNTQPSKNDSATLKTQNNTS